MIVPQDEFELAKFVVLRTPLLPFSVFTDFSARSGLNAEATPPTSDVEGERARLRHRLRALFDGSQLREALLVASASLHERLKDWTPSNADRKSLKTQHALMKYFSRMTYRCTPYGLLAGFSWAPVAPSEDIGSELVVELSAAEAYRRHCRIDMTATAAMGARFLADSSIKRSLSYFPNPTLYRHGSHWRYIEAKRSGGLRRFVLSAVECSPHLDALLSDLEAREEPVPFSQMARVLGKVVCDASGEDIDEYVVALIDNGLLLSTLEPPLTSGDSFAHVLPALAESSDQTVKANLCALAAHLVEINSTPVGAGAEAIQRLESEVRTLVDDSLVRDVLQTDLQKPVERICLPRSVIREVDAALKVLRSLSPPPSHSLEQFSVAFAERYGDREVPLVEALDPDSGLPYGNAGDDDLPLLDRIPIRNPEPTLKPRRADEDLRTRLLIRAFERACRNNLSEIVLTDADVASLGDGRSRPTPQSFCVVIALSGGLPGSSVLRPRIFIKWISHTNGGSWLGRFCAADEGLAAHTREYLRSEERNGDPDAIYAELVHWPVNRLGNIILRPQLRPYELPLFGRASVPKQRQLLIRDLLVSVRDGRVVLRCQRSGKPVIPRLTNAHNTNLNSIPLYRFLSDLQMQDASISRFKWPDSFREASRLPRVVYGGCVLSPQCWILHQDELHRLRNVSQQDAYSCVQNWRRAFDWPRFVELAETDNTLCIDLENPLSVDCFAHEIRDRSSATLREVFPVDELTKVRGPEGGFCHEIILPFVRRRPLSRSVEASSSTVSTARPKVLAPAVRRHIPGGHWLYYKVYCGTSGAERLLAEYLAPLVDRLFEEGLVERWFFLRYRDPHHHLRLRFQGDPQKLWGSAILIAREVLDRACDRQWAWKVIADSYEPEFDRYGGRSAMAIVEAMFQIDSECALRLIAEGNLQEPDWRWKWIAYGVDLFWRTIVPDTPKRADLYTGLTRELRQTYEEAKVTKVAIDQRFRGIRTELHDLLLGEHEQTNTAQQHFERRTHDLQPCIQRLRDLNTAGELTVPIGAVLNSCAHMSINRLCLASNGAQEFVIYEVLARLLRTHIARAAAARLDTEARLAASIP